MDRSGRFVISKSTGDGIRSKGGLRSVELRRRASATSQRRDGRRQLRSPAASGPFDVIRHMPLNWSTVLIV